MTKKRNVIHSLVVLMIGLLGGVAGAAFSLGEERQYIKDTLTLHESSIESIEETTQEEMDRYTSLITSQIMVLQNSIKEVTALIHKLHTDVEVLKAITDRIEICSGQKLNTD